MNKLFFHVRNISNPTNIIKLVYNENAENVCYKNVIYCSFKFYNFFGSSFTILKMTMTNYFAPLWVGKVMKELEIQPFR